MRTRSGLLVGIGLAALGRGVPEAATTRILFHAGDRASDGTRVDTVSAPAGDRTGVAFRGATGAILIRDGGTYTVVVRSGDPLPAPLVGTFGNVGNPRINDAGVVAFRATLDDGSSAIFYRGPAGTERVPSAGSAAAFDLNDAGDVVFRQATRVFRWRPGGTVDTVLPLRAAVPGGRIRTLYRSPVLGDGGHAVLVAALRRTTGTPRTARALVLVAPDGTPTTIGIAGDASPTGAVYALTSTAPAAVNASGQVAFASRLRRSGWGVFLYTPGAGTAVVAKTGDVVGGLRLSDQPIAWVGVDSHGAVAFHGVFDDAGATPGRLVLAAGGPPVILAVDAGGTFAPALTETGQIVWARDGFLYRYDGAVTVVAAASDATPIGVGFNPTNPSVNDAGVTAFESTREALYLLGDTPPAAALTAGDPVPGAGTVTDLGTHAVRDGAVGLYATTDARRAILYRRAGESFAPAARSGDLTPTGGTFALDPEILDVDRGAVVFASEIDDGDATAAVFRATRGEAIRTLARAGATALDRSVLQSFLAVAAFGRGAAFLADVSETSDAAGLFVVNAPRRRPRRIAVAAGRSPIGGRWDSFSPPVALGGRVLFAATVLRGRAPGGLFAWTAATGVVAVAVQGRRARDGVPMGAPRGAASVFAPYALGPRFAAFVGPRLTSVALYVRRSGRPEAVLLPTAGVAGSPIESFGSALSIRGDEIVCAATLATGVALIGVTP